ncbi:hypothetical protein ACFL24_00455 [Patescibacteria group bacterium]
MKDDRRKIKKIEANGDSTPVVAAASIQIQIKIPSISSPNHQLSPTFSFTFYLLLEDFYLQEIEIWDKIKKNPPEISGEFRYEFQGQEYQSKEYLLRSYLRKEASIFFLPSLESTEEGPGTAGRFIALVLKNLHDTGWIDSPHVIIKDTAEEMEAEFCPSNLNLKPEKFLEFITGIRDEMVRAIEIMYPHQEEEEKEKENRALT